MNTDRRYEEASIKTADTLKAIAQSPAARKLSQLTLPEIEAIVNQIARIVPAGNMPSLILSGLIRLPGRRLSPKTVKQDINLLFRGLEQVLDTAVYGTFFAGPAAIIWAYQSLLKLAGINLVDAFPEGVWQFYVNYAMREDTARHACETHGFDTYLQQHQIQLETTDRLTAWVMAASHSLHHYDALLANEWRERAYLHFRAEVIQNEPNSNRFSRLKTSKFEEPARPRAAPNRFSKLYRKWEQQRPYGLVSTTLTNQTYPVFRRHRFDRFLEPALNTLPNNLRDQWRQRVGRAEIEDLPAYQRQMSILAYLDPDKYDEILTPLPLEKARVGLIYKGCYYFIPACAPDSSQALARAQQTPTPLRAASHKIAQERKPMSTQPTVFISYTREDEDEKEALLTHLRVLAQDRLIDIWSDDQIGVGDTWQREVEQAMTRADVAILLITADYLASSFIQDEQLPKLLHRRKDDGLKIFPIIAKPCAWQVVSWLKQMETRPKHGQAIWRSEGRHAHEDLAEIVSEIEGIVRQNAPGALDDELIGTFLDKYQLIKLLGRGSAAKVYQTYHPGLYCYMAIKVMDSHLMSESALERFRGEASAVVGLRHNNIIRVYDFNQAKGKHYMVMDLIEGPTLEAKLAARQGSRQPFTLDETIDIISALADALDYAHSQGVIHHDLKPANIMFTTDDPKGQLILTDFGIARIMDAGNQTIAGMFLGTPNYTAPEQAQGQRGDKRSDIYSLGVILYQMLTGRLPFEADTSKNVIQQHINVPPLPPTQFNPDLSTGVEQVILRALSKNPDDRYPSAGEMAGALQRSLQMKELKKQDQVEEEVNNRPHLEIEIIKKFNDSCSSYQQALHAWRNKDSTEYEARLRNAATLAVGALEWALKDYLDLACNGTKDYAKVNRARFHELLGLMEQYGQPPLPALQSHQLSKYRKIRNAEQHEKITPTQQQVDRAITDVREFLLTYFVIEGDQLKMDCSNTQEEDFERKNQEADQGGSKVGHRRGTILDQNVTGDGNIAIQVSGSPTGDISVGTPSPTLSPAARSGPGFSPGSIRKKLNQLFDDASLNDFCLDYFPDVFDKFSRGMQKNEKISLLLDHCRRFPNRQQTLLDALKNYDE